MTSCLILAHWHHDTKTWCHPQNRKYTTYRNATRGWLSQQHAQKNLATFGRRVMRAYRRTNKHTHYNTSHPSRGQRKNFWYALSIWAWAPTTLIRQLLGQCLCCRRPNTLSDASRRLRPEWAVSVCERDWALGWFVSTMPLTRLRRKQHTLRRHCAISSSSKTAILRNHWKGNRWRIKDTHHWT